jgi:diamine N-acetyltransferase
LAGYIDGFKPAGEKVTTRSPELPVINLKGERVALGPLRRDLVSTYLRWLNDFDVTRGLAFGMRPVTLESEEAWYDRAAKATDELHFTLYERDTLKPVGNAALVHVDHRNRTAEYGIVIGDKEYWNRGFGTEATSLVLSYAFLGLNLHSVMLRVHSDNDRAMAAYKKAGFEVMGRRRDAVWTSGRPLDVVYMDCLSTEIEKRLPGLLQ